MITKGIIETIDLTGNTCALRIPLFETAGTKNKIVMQSTFSVPPGVYNAYNVGDIVWVAFETTGVSDPVVIGKLYLGAAAEKNTTGGAGNYTDMVVSNSLTIPSTTKIIFDPTSNTVIKNNEITLNKYNSIQNIIKAVQANSQQILDLKNTGHVFFNTESTVGTWHNGKVLYQRVLTYAPSNNNDPVEINLPELPDLNQEVAYDEAFIDTSHSYYFENTDTVANIATGTINLNTKKITIPATVGKNGTITILYTKKYPTSQNSNEN